MKQEPKKEKEYTIGFLIFLIISATVIGVLFINSLNCCIPETSKFNAEIWGTVSDWFTYLASAIGIAFITKTLESQMKVQKEQENINKLNAYDIRTKHRGDIIFDEKHKLNTENISKYLEFNFTAIENDIINLSIDTSLKSSVSPSQNKEKKYLNNLPIVRENSFFKIEIDTQEYMDFSNNCFKPTDTFTTPPIKYLGIKFTYFDNFGLEYSKSFEFDIYSKGRRLEKKESNITYK